jgi:hypothetical protein
MSKRRSSASHSRVIPVEKNRFAAGWRLLPDEDLVWRIPTPQRQPDISFDVIRPADLVSFTVDGYGVELVGGNEPYLRRAGCASSRLVVWFSFQHLGERAFFEATLVLIPKEERPTDPPEMWWTLAENPEPPVEARPARTSRLVFDIPDGFKIPFSIAGILDAIGRLPMVVHPLAKQKPGSPEAEGATLHLPEGLIAVGGCQGLVVRRAPRRMAIPDPKSSAGVAAIARSLRRARTLLASTAGVVIRSGDLPTSDYRRTVSIGGKTYTLPPLIGPHGLIRLEKPAKALPSIKILSRSPRALETAIEAPFRLIVSPSKRGGWAHAIEPVAAEDRPRQIELWHSRLGVRVEDEDSVTVDERAQWQRIVRAVWARDREAMSNWQTDDPDHEDDPFCMSLDGADRHMLVRQSAEVWLGQGGKPILPEPVDTRALWLSGLGAWLDLHGMWDSMPYSMAGIPSILCWDHVAPMGRDQFVRVVYPGYLFPFGHSATLVKLTERKMMESENPYAYLYQRKFLVVNEPIRNYNQLDLPFDQVRLAPLVTPNLDDPGNLQSSFFFPTIDGKRFHFVLHCLDRESRPVRLLAPLMWVAEHYQNSEPDDGTEPLQEVNEAYNIDSQHAYDVPASGQEITFTIVARGGDTMLPTQELHFSGEAIKFGTSIPKLEEACVELPAVKQLSDVGPVTVKYANKYLNNGFGGANAGEVWAEVVTDATMSFGGSTASGSDRAGGFIQPNIPIRGLSRTKGTVGDIETASEDDFNPEDFFGDMENLFPKLFGIVPLVELLVGGDGDLAPTVISESLDYAESFVSDLDRLMEIAPAITGQVNAVKGALINLQSADDKTGPLNGALNQLGDALTTLEQDASTLPLFTRNQLLNSSKNVRTVLDKDVEERNSILVSALDGMVPGGAQTAFRFEWNPTIKSWPSGDPVLEFLGNKNDSLVIAVDGRISGEGVKGIEVLAELRDFRLNLLPGEKLVCFKFKHISFRSGSSGKAEVDVVLEDIEFVGILGFIETLKDLIPFDGFSDPPYVDVSPEGLTAGFSLALPNVAIGVFNLSNLSLGADVQVPFLGNVVTVGFNFCTRERPFKLAVTFFGGGGWFLLRLSPDGLEVLELGLEAGAMLAVDFGVASGSVSGMLGIYMRLEGDAGSLTGYLRLRGEVDVLSLISASIELYLALAYNFDTGKMVGKAKLTIKVEVICFSGKVTIRAERRFAGSKGDPSFADIMVLPDGSSPAWSEYCAAFAGE